MTSYRQEQLEGYGLVIGHLATLGGNERTSLERAVAPYMDFRRRAADFLHAHFAGICTRDCYENQRSACCSKDGIITFFGDLVVNALISDPQGLERIEERLGQPHQGFKCVYLGPRGCL